VKGGGMKLTEIFPADKMRKFLEEKIPKYHPELTEDEQKKTIDLIVKKLYSKKEGRGDHATR
jgi:hypothetical protein